MMRISTRLRGLLLTLLTAVTCWADVPFKVTTITDGQFAFGTCWYTIQIDSSGLVISDNADASYISLDRITTTKDDADLWCFIGDDTNGYRLYNKAAGTGKVLASPTTMSGTTGATAYVVLKDTADLTSYTADWLFATSTDVGEDGQYMYQMGTTANKVNNRDGKLAFWTGGADAGSTLTITFAKAEFCIASSTGSFTASNSAKTWHSNWQSTATSPSVSLNSGYNNMKTEGENIVAYVGMYSPQAYTLSTDANYIIAGYTFKYKVYGTDSSKTLTVSNDSTTATSAADYQTFSCSGLKEQTATFTLSGSNNGIEIDSFYVVVEMSEEEPEPQTDIFVTNPDDIVYRIPAVTKMHNGDLLVVSDYRYSGTDIGMGGRNGRIDIHARISEDNGQTWGEKFAIIEGQGSSSPDNMHVGFGDPCLVADSETDSVLLVTCAGAYSYSSGTRANHLEVVRFYSGDNGKTWSEPEAFDESLYTQLDESAIGQVKSLFIGSGRIFQSSTVKVGSHYRLYCSMLAKDVNSVEKNYVIYSDDFGKTWAFLGGVDVAPVPSGANEPKAEELPDGSILCSSRTSGGRYYNIFTFTNSEKAEGSWGTVAFSGKSNNGVATESASCNGEVYILPALRIADNQPVYIALQSLPMASTRSRVGIAYKELATLSDFNTPENFAKDWDGQKIVSKIGSAYSTMALQADSTIAFVYEEETYGADYTIVYKNYSLEQITDSTYKYYPEAVADSIVSSGMAEVMASAENYFGTCVGNLRVDDKPAVETAYQAYVAQPNKTNYEAFNAAINNAERIEISSAIKYRLRNSGRSDATLYLTATGSGYTAQTLEETDSAQLFSFYAAAVDGAYYIANDKFGTYVGKTPAIYKVVSERASRSGASSYSISSSLEGLSAIVCLNPTNSSYPALHLSSSGTIVPWTTTAEASLWYIEPTDIETAINLLPADNASKTSESYFDLLGHRVSTPVKGSLYVTDQRRKVIFK